MATAKKITDKNIDAVARKHIDELRKPGVLTVRPGYEIAGHRLTGKRAVVATVHTKQDVPPAEALPTHLDGIPVDVREATPDQRLRAHDPMAAAIVKTFERPEDEAPEWPLEREMPSGKLLVDPKNTANKVLADNAKRATPAHRVLAKRTTKSTKKAIPYGTAAGASLQPFTTRANITTLASPDAGLATLEGFLAKTSQSLVVGMYDFTSSRILSAFESALSGPRTLKMVLDNPAPNDTRDQLDIQTVEDLDTKVGNRASIVRALTASDPYVSAKIFPSAYHIKVIVRDAASVWLSSGNLNNSNEPDLDSPPHTEDRDWHVIVDDPTLAATFTALIEHDFDQAEPNQLSATDASVVAEAAIAKDAQAKRAAEANPPPAGTTKPSSAPPVKAKVFTNEPMTLTPIMTPDTIGDPGPGQYLTTIEKLIAGAQHSLYIQLQYIEASKGTGTHYDALLQAIADRVTAGVDVRLIENGRYGEKWAEKMKSAGVDLTANIRMQTNIHNKGFVVDDDQVVVSSQNFSPQGVELNRDAGLIIQSANVNAYFKDIFEADWEQSKPFAPKGATAQPEPGAMAKTTRTPRSRSTTGATAKKAAVKRAVPRPYARRSTSQKPRT